MTAKGPDHDAERETSPAGWEDAILVWNGIVSKSRPRERVEADVVRQRSSAIRAAASAAPSVSTGR